jgi:AmmeMemoRadiSam system protein A
MSPHEASEDQGRGLRGEGEIPPDAQRVLLAMARQAIARKLNLEYPAPVADPPQALQKTCGVFVTLLENGRLRGCIGSLEGKRPLSVLVPEMAEAAAFLDPRFPPVTPEEFPNIVIEISVLSPLEPVQDISEIRVGEHGLLVRLGSNQGLLLPQVAVENKWDLPTFLSHTCLKAGLPADAWRDPEAEIYRFRAQVFGEEEDAERSA